MPHVTVQKAECGKGTAVNPFFLRWEDTLEAVRKRAFQLFEMRGRAPGGDVGDWLKAEQDLFFVPKAEIAETDQGFTMKLTMAGFEAQNIDVMTRGSEIVVRASSKKCTSAKDASGENDVHCEAKSRLLYRHFDLPAAMDAGRVKASFNNGILTIEAPRITLQPVLARSVAA